MKQSAAQLVWRWLWIALNIQLCKTCHIQDSSTSSHKNLICLITFEDTVTFMVDIHGHRGEFDLAPDNNGETVKLLDPRSLVTGVYV